MSGYTPVFSGIYDGTLYGRWPAAAVFASLLPLADRNGKIDITLQAIAGRTGWPLDLLKEGIRQLMEPDPDSRTGDLEGRRLALIDPETRNWGWNVVNHGLYREKARKASYDADRTQSGLDAERKRAEREQKAAKDAVPRSPAKSRAVPLSDSDSDSDSNTNKNQNLSARSAQGTTGADPGTRSDIDIASRKEPEPEALNGSEPEPPRKPRYVDAGLTAILTHAREVGYPGSIGKLEDPKDFAAKVKAWENRPAAAAVAERIAKGLKAP